VNFFKNIALINGCPNIRYVTVPRIGTPSEMVATYYDNIIQALTEPLTAEEEGGAGLYSPPAPPRVLIEGTLDECHDFLQQTTLVENCRNCPIAKYTDGLPVVVPTEEKVAEMLTGTSHDPDEEIARIYDAPGFTIAAGGMQKAGSSLVYSFSYTATVEKAAVCAVMAGCKPEYLPVALAIATAGGGTVYCPGTSSMASVLYMVSGPIAKEIGMNAGQNALDVGNHANMSLGRVGALMSINFGGCITGLVRTDSGNLIHSTCFPEDLDGLPPGWVGFNEEATYSMEGETVNYTKDESVIAKIGGQSFSTGLLSFPGYYRSLNAGQMGLARMLGVEGVPGKYNWMEAICPVLAKMYPSPGGAFWILHMNLADLLYEHGFKSKAEVYQWLYDSYFVTVEEYYNTGLWEFMVAVMPIERTSGKTWYELLETDPDYKLHVFGRNCIVVSDSFADEHWYFSSGGPPTAYPIDPWR
jgi:hypothetical protein